MININIISVGKLKEKYLKMASDEYLKRLSGFCRLNIIELNEYKISDNPSAKEIENGLSAEAKIMSQYINVKSAFNIAMCIEGKKLSSEKLSKEIEKCGVNGFSTLNFIIGSSFGISEEIKNKSHLKLSMSDMTFPHQLARIMLLEQIYRSFQISKGTKYHK
ncbi:MAG: 23S rRNA (pseudouridine(1915)-N(3))-methyltransferase RlmH [Clostridiales bacterium]|nr:23S rRNA (pseudouridine(1915)-N(3))-methyltransferase RlmH [Clostridiales bacterium]